MSVWDQEHRKYIAQQIEANQSPTAGDLIVFLSSLAMTLNRFSFAEIEVLLRAYQKKYYLIALPFDPSFEVEGARCVDIIDSSIDKSFYVLTCASKTEASTRLAAFGISEQDNTKNLAMAGVLLDPSLR